MAIYIGKETNRVYNLESSPFVAGGEGSIYNIPSDPNLVAKIYHTQNRTTERERKILFMIDNPPGHQEQYAWPRDALYDSGKFAGFVMRKVNGGSKIHHAYSWDNRQNVSWFVFVRIAKNVAAAVNTIHQAEQVIGDFKPDNILVQNDGLVTFVDNDSYHIKGNNRVFRCNMATPEFSAPELHGIHFPSAPLPTFTKESDRFSLAILIFQILMNGVHPFSCLVTGESQSHFQPIENIQRGICPYFSESKLPNSKISTLSPDLGCLPPTVRNLFYSAFVLGIKNPGARPSASEWYNALKDLENNLVTCSNGHMCYKGSDQCPWCYVEYKVGKRSRDSIARINVSNRTRQTRTTTTRNSGRRDDIIPDEPIIRDDPPFRKEKVIPDFKVIPDGPGRDPNPKKPKLATKIIAGLLIVAAAIAIPVAYNAGRSTVVDPVPYVDVVPDTEEPDTYQETPEEVDTPDVPVEPEVVNTDPVRFHDLKVISTTNETLFGDFFNPGEIENLYGTTYYAYYELVSYVARYSGYEDMVPYVESLTNGEYSTFTGTVFCGKMDENDQIEFRVYKDNNQIYSTGMIGPRTQPIDFSLDISGATTIKIEAYSPVQAYDLAPNPRIIATDLYVHP